MPLRFKNHVIRVQFILLILFPLFFRAQSTYYLSEKSKIHFISETENEIIEARNASIEGYLNIKTAQLKLKVPVEHFEFQKELMKKRFNEIYLESEKYPYSAFEGNIEGDFNILDNGTYPIIAAGNLEIHGKHKYIRVPLTLLVQDQVVWLTGSFKILLEDFDIDLPILATVLKKISEEIEISIKGNFVREN